MVSTKANEPTFLYISFFLGDGSETGHPRVAKHKLLYSFRFMALPDGKKEHLASYEQYSQLVALSEAAKLRSPDAGRLGR